MLFYQLTNGVDIKIADYKKNKDGKCIHEVASQEWLDHYMKTRMAPLEEK